MALKGRRVESPSSINIYRQCPRKYYYQYIKRLPTGSSIHLIRGSLVHQVLEDFYDIDLEEPQIQNFKFLHLRALQLLKRYWTTNKELPLLGLTPEELQFYYDESVMMIQNWFNRFRKRLEARMQQGESFIEAFLNLTPTREEEYRSEEFMVRGYIDYIHEVDGKILVMDYKTSKKDLITEDYRLQLAIYAMMYEEKHGRKPDYVGIDFLKSIEKMLPVDDALITDAKFALEQIHQATISDDITDYPQNITPLCKWRTGQCDFYDVCFGNMTIEDFKEKNKKK